MTGVYNFKMIHPPCVLCNKNQSRFSQTQSLTKSTVIFVDILLPRGTLAIEPSFHRDDTNEELL
jgi:hypothetical protein